MTGEERRDGDILRDFLVRLDRECPWVFGRRPVREPLNVRASLEGFDPPDNTTGEPNVIPLAEVKPSPVADREEVT